MSANRQQAMFDPVARKALDGFLSPKNPQITRWLPKYVDSVQATRADLGSGQVDAAFRRIWKSEDNWISSAGQGVMGFDEADRLRDRLIDIIRAIERDDSPANFDALLARLGQWRQQGELTKVPRLLLARAFAAIHPERYHTTVDQSKQDRIIPWFVEHTGFVEPEGSWAVKAASLTTHLDRCAVFDRSQHHRNIFPWFVFDHLRDADEPLVFRPGYVVPDANTVIVERPAQSLSVSRRHVQIQKLLYKRLCDHLGRDCTAGEHPTGTGGRADLLVKRKNGRYDLYEVKPAAHAAEAVRQAVGQLLEYGYWLGGLDPARLYVVSDAPLDKLTEGYLKALKDRFGLRLNYLHIDISDDK